MQPALDGGSLTLFICHYKETQLGVFSSSILLNKDDITKSKLSAALIAHNYVYNKLLQLIYIVCM